MSKTLAQLRQRMSEQIGDWISETVTTNLADNKYIYCSTLNEYTLRDDCFTRWYALVTSQNNSGTSRKIQGYQASTNCLTVYGANFSADSSAATFEIHRYNPEHFTIAINRACRSLYPYLFKVIDWDDSLIMGNILPNSYFEDWDSSSALTYYTASNVTLAQGSTVRGGIYSVKATASADNGYLYISSANYPELLNLSGETVTFRAWAYPEVADNAYIEIYTVQADGTAQTLTSSTACPAGKWTLLKLDDQSLNDNLSEIQVRFKVATNTKYVYFDNARITGPALSEIMLPKDFRSGNILAVYEQISGQTTSESDNLCDSLNTNMSQVSSLFGWDITDRNGARYLRMPYPRSDKRKLILRGYVPLESNLSADTSTVSISDPYTDLLVAESIANLYDLQSNLTSTQDVSRVQTSMIYWKNEAERLKSTLRMIPPQGLTRFRSV